MKRWCSFRNSKEVGFQLHRAQGGQRVSTDRNYLQEWFGTAGGCHNVSSTCSEVPPTSHISRMEENPCHSSHFSVHCSLHIARLWHLTYEACSGINSNPEVKKNLHAALPFLQRWNVILTMVLLLETMFTLSSSTHGPKRNLVRM